MTIYVSGSLAYDRIMTFPGRFADHILPEKIHVLNVCFLVNGLTEKFGGTAGNIAYSLALLGEKPLILATAGKDFDRYADWLINHGLDLSGIRRLDDEHTGGAYITTDLADNQITGFNPGAMRHASLYDLAGCDPKACLAIVAPGNVEDMVAYGAAYQRLGLPYIFDPGQQIPALSGEQLRNLIAGSTILISNDYELDLMAKATGWTKAQIQSHTKAVITTLAEKGSLVRQDGLTTTVPAVSAAQVKDPTGAGDAYRSGLIKGLVLGRDLVEAARLGATCASFAVERHGTQEHAFSQEEFWARHRACFG